MLKNKKIKVSGKSKDIIIPARIADESEWAKLLKQKQDPKKSASPKTPVKGFKLSDGRQVTHNLRRRMGR